MAFFVRFRKPGSLGERRGTGLSAILPSSARFLVLLSLFAAAAVLVAGGRSLAAAGSPPTITNFSPTSGMSGTSVTITGTNFTGASAVAFNGTTAAYTVDTDNQITATVPSGATSGPITVSTPGGQATTATSAPMSFVNVGIASLTSGTTSLRLALPSGYQAGDLLIAWLAFADNAQSITGMTGWTQFPWSPLDDGTTWHVRCFYKIATSGELAPTAKWTNNTKAIFQTAAWRGVDQTSPIAASGGALDLVSSNNVVGPTVTHQLPGAWAVGFFTYRTSQTADKNTNFSSFTPSGLTERADSNLGAAAYASWENVATADSGGPLVSAINQFTGVTTGTTRSAHKAAALIYLAPNASGGGAFTVIPPPTPTISGFSPGSGPVGSTVTITGTNLTGTSAVSFNGSSATYTVTSNTQISATVPSGASSGPLSLTTPNGQATSSSNFTVTIPPTISGFSPSSGPVGSTVTITGTNLNGTSAVSFNGSSATYTVTSNTQISATVPSGASSGPLSLTTPNGQATSSSNFTVTVGPPPPAFAVYAGYYDTHHDNNPQPKPSPWQGAANVVFVGQPDSSSGGWDSSAVRVDNLGGAPLTNVVVTVSIGSSNFALWGTNTIPAGQSLIVTQMGNGTFDGSDENPAGCYGCDPALCTTQLSFAIPVVHVTINGQTTNISDPKQILNTHGVDSAGCPPTGGTSIRNDESEVWQQLG